MPREKLQKYGVESLSESELLSIIIGYGTKDLNVFDLSQKIIGDENTSELLKLTFEDLMKIRGIKEAKATKIIAAIELAKRIFSYVPDDFIYRNASSIYNYLKSYYLDKRHEELLAIYLDSSLHIICKKVITVGTSDSVIPNYQLIFKYAFQYSSENIIISHNHPSGITDPSDADISFTMELERMASELNMCLLDHIIVSANGYYSFLANKKLKII